MSSYSSTSSESTTSPRKDYSSALANLQSNYGFGGVPALAPISAPAMARREPATNVFDNPITHPNSGAKKDYSGALANLQASYGFGNMPAPTLPASLSGRRT